MDRTRHTIPFSLLAAFLLGLLAACSPLDKDLPIDPESGRPTVPVSLSLAIAPEDSATKADHEPDAEGYDTDAAVKTLLVLQFEWQDAVNRDAALLISQQFVEYGDPVSLVASDARNTVFVVANAWGKAPVAIGTPLGTFLAGQNYNQLTGLDELTGKGIWYSPNGGADRYLRMSASLELPDGVSGGTVGPFYLRRNCAKVVIHVRNTSADPDKVTIDKVQLCDVNRRYYYVMDYPGFSDPYSRVIPCRYDEAEQDFPEAYNASGDTQTYTYYVPVNLRGTVANATQREKNAHAVQGATRFCIYATYGTPVRNLTYTYYLGANLTSDYNLEPNKKYEYTIDINGKGDPATDSRIEDADEIRFTVDANSYMLKPPSRSGTSTVFSFPVRRAAVFWNQPGTNMGVFGAATTEEYELLEDTAWEAFIVWSEVKDGEGHPVPDSELLADSHDDGNGNFVAAGRGFDPSGAAGPFIRIRVRSDMRGNALVAIRKTSSPTLNDILWSWHLWITDYDPYVQWTRVSGTYVYAVPGGEIHRYADKAGEPLWNTAAYADAFIMDRNLGARAAVPGGESDASSAFGCFYQFGRKDPFPADGTVTSIGADMTGAPGEGTIKRNIRYSIHHPETFINGGNNNWTTYETEGAILGHQNAYWNDPGRDAHSDDPSEAAFDYCEAGKSVYDPCPYGWRVPAMKVWSGFSTATVQWTTAPVKALYYYPEGYDPSAPKGSLFFPSPGYRRPSRQDSGTNGYYWTDDPGSATYARGLRFYASGGMTLSSIGVSNYYRSSGYPVRCIRLRDSRPF